MHKEIKGKMVKIEKLSKKDLILDALKSCAMHLLAAGLVISGLGIFIIVTVPWFFGSEMAAASTRFYFILGMILAFFLPLVASIGFGSRLSLNVMYKISLLYWLGVMFIFHK